MDAVPAAAAGNEARAEKERAELAAQRERAAEEAQEAGLKRRQEADAKTAAKEVFGELAPLAKAVELQAKFNRIMELGESGAIPNADFTKFVDEYESGTTSFLDAADHVDKQEGLMSGEEFEQKFSDSWLKGVEASMDALLKSYDDLES